ncbi:MAG: glycosyltransferase [Candidatus Latescibacteria bacterium]|jgi:glycosyltransferase involved in cell wall biosynthesis|nr:glycosyltransferase [Candidatus Latescibacterota bacterium]
MPKISIILPVYNAADTLAQALDSLLAQRFRDFEIIAIDDGSTDTSTNILDVYANKDSRIKAISSTHQGLIPTLNRGIEKASGNFIARMDADDVSHPDRLDRQLDFLQHNPHIAIVSSRIQCFPRHRVAKGFRIYEAWLNALCTPEDIAREIFIESPVVHPSILIRRACLNAAGGYRDFGWVEDYDLWLRLHLTGYQFAKVPATLHFWREHTNRLTRQDDRYSADNFLRAKAHYLSQGSLSNNPHTIIWGSGQIGGRLSKHLLAKSIETVAFVDIAPKKIGNTRHGIPIISPEDLPTTWSANDLPLILAALPSRGARDKIRQYLCAHDLIEGQHFLCVA